MCGKQVVPPLAAATIEIEPDDTLAPAGTVSAVVEGMLVVQARCSTPGPPPLLHTHRFVSARSVCASRFLAVQCKALPDCKVAQPAGQKVGARAGWCVQGPESRREHLSAAKRCESCCVRRARDGGTRGTAPGGRAPRCRRGS